MSGSTTGTEPMLITPLYDIENDSRVIHRIVRPEGDVETVLLRDNGSHRIAIQDRETVHAFMEIQADDDDLLDPKNRMCWTTFEQMGRSVLCVLICATQVRLWDAGSFLGGGEGTTVHLPCEATSIFPTNKGLLIQRQFVLDDQQNDDDGDMVFLSKSSHEPEPEPSTSLASLFSLSHPLKTVLPVANTSILEQVVFVGTLRDDTQICVTFHVDLRRHAVWILADAPPPPPLPSNDSWKVDEAATATFIVQQDLLREEGSFYEGMSSRQEALADALGVGARQGTNLATPTGILHNGMTPLHPDLSLTLMYEALPKSPAVASNIFLADAYLCLQIESDLEIWKVQSGCVQAMASLPCKSAIPIQCMPRSEMDILLVNKGLQLYRGELFLADVAYRGEDVLKLKDSCEHGRFTMELQSGQHSKAALNLTVPPLVEHALMAFRETVGAALSMHVRMDCLRLIQEFTNANTPDPAWASLCYVVERLLGLSEPVSRKEDASYWETLYQSEYCSTHEHSFSTIRPEYSVRPQRGISSYVAEVNLQSQLYMNQLGETRAVRIKMFEALHLLYEELKLSMMTKPWCQQLRTMLRGCCSDAMQDFVEHYTRDDSALESSVVDARQFGRLASFAKPPCIMSWLADCLECKREDESWVHSAQIALACPRIRLTRDIFSTLTSALESGQSTIRRDITIVRALIEAGIKDAWFLQDDFPIGVALPLMEVLARCRDFSNIMELDELSEETWHFIGREDICMQTVASRSARQLNDEQTIGTSDEDHDGLDTIQTSHALRFPTDNRLKEVARLLRSSRPMFLKVPRAVELSDHDYEKLKQERLLTLCRRALALPIGRGMLTLGTLKPIPAEQLPIPEVCLSGRVPPTNSSLALDTSNTPADMTVWPDFHNGVAAGLRLPPAESHCETFKISRSWIIYNRAASCSGETSESGSLLPHAHGGLLMALGLRGHLSALSMTDIYEYLTQGSVTTSVGVLLGMAANKRGTCDPSVSKMLCLHIPSLLPPSFSSIDVSAPAHAAAVAGIGLLYQYSSHRLMTEFLLNEMGRRPIHDSSTVDREAYTLCCGISLGMINLAKGGNNAGLADLEIEQRLYRYIVGGLDDRAQRKGQDTADRRLHGSGGSLGESERCSRVYEGDAINNDITAPGALMALGLMYLKSGNKAVASGLALPDTHFLLEYARPDTLMLRVLARSMILWDDVEPSVEWIELQIPSVVQRAYLKMRSIAAKAAQVAERAFGNELEGNSSEIPSAAPSANASTAAVSGERQNGGLENGKGLPDVDRQTVRQMHAYIVAGSCFSIGIRYAGTADSRAAAAITEVLLELKSFRDTNDPIPAALRPEQPVVGMCLGLCAVSLALVMAGTGDLDTLRLLKTIRWRSDDQIRHGAHMTIAAAIGLLFLGSGTCTVGRSAEDVAALVAAFFPRFPMNSTDNKYHLQALRHLYALAVKGRYVQTIDVDSGEGVAVPVEACFEEHGTKPIRLITPNLLSNTERTLAKLVVRSDLYFPSSLMASEACGNDGFVLYVRKRGNVPQCQLAKSSTFPWEASKHLQTMLQTTSDNSECQCVDSRSSFCFRSFFGCVSRTTSPATVPILGSLKVVNSHRANALAWDTMLIQNYYCGPGGRVHDDGALRPNSAALIVERAKRVLEENDRRLRDARRCDAMDTS